MNCLNTASASVAIVLALLAGCTIQPAVKVPDSAGQVDQKSAGPTAGRYSKPADNAIDLNPHPETKADKFSAVDDSAIAP